MRHDLEENLYPEESLDPEESPGKELLTAVWRVGSGR